MNEVRPIKIVSTSMQVANILRYEIFTRKRKEGDIINLKAIAERQGISNTPVREALQLLSQDGLVKLRPNKGAVVLGITKERVRDHYETRIILEAAAVRKACAAADRSSIAVAFEREEEIVRASRFSEYPEYNQTFHKEIWQTTNNYRLISLLTSLWNWNARSMYSTEREYGLTSHEEHQKIMQSIQDRDADLAAEYMEKHLIRSMEDIITYLEET